MHDSISVNIIEKNSLSDFFETWRKQVEVPLPGIDVSVWKQIRFCKTKKKRVLKKWRNNPKNFEITELKNCHIENVTMTEESDSLNIESIISYKNI